MEQTASTGYEGSGWPGERLIERLDPKLVNVITVLGFGIPIAGYFWAIARYSVNVMVGDQWSDVIVIKASYSHLIPWGALWTPWNENRMFFPRLIVIVLGRSVHFNTQVEEYLSATMLLGATTLLIWSHKRRSPRTPWLYYCPVAFLTFSLVQVGNTLFGFQMAWYLVLLSLAVTMALLDRAMLTWLPFIGAIAAGVVGSFSSFQGLLIWPAGLVLLYHRRRRAPLTIAWIVAGLAAVLVYFHNFNPISSSPVSNFARQHPVAALKFYLYLVGDVVGASPGHSNDFVLVGGAVIVILALGTVVMCGIHRDEHGGGPIGIALICFGLLFAGSVTQGRIVFGYASASVTRYTTYDLLILVGIYLTLLGRPTLSVDRRKPAANVAGETHLGASQPRIASGSARSISYGAARLVQWLVVALVVGQILLGLPNGLSHFRSTNQTQEHYVDFIRNLDGNYEPLLQLGPYSLGPLIRAEIPTAQRLRLSLFTTSNVPRQRVPAPPPARKSEVPVPVTKVVNLANGTRLSGTTILDASASNATSVKFRMVGGSYGFSGPTLCSALPINGGWMCSWNSATVRNGSYVVLSEAFNAGGSAFSTNGVRITVKNPPHA